MFSVAEKTGWPERYIMDELPLARLLAYEHCALYKDDVWTVPRRVKSNAPIVLFPRREIDAEPESDEWDDL